MKSRNDQAEVRYPGIQAKVQEYLRRRWAAQSGSSCRVTTAIVVENVGHNRTTISSAMATLARTPDTGLSDVSAGLYNYTAALDKEYVTQRRRDGMDILPEPGTSVTDPALKVTHPVRTPLVARPTPASLPRRRTTTPVHEDPVVVVSARGAHPEAPVAESASMTRAGTPRVRQAMQRGIGLRALRWLQEPENRGQIFSIAEVADAIGGLRPTVGTLLRQYADNPDFPVRRIMPGTLYTVPLSAAEQRAQDDELATQYEDLQAAIVAGPVRAPEPVAEPVPAPVVPEPAPVPVAAPEPISEPAPVQQDDDMVLLEKLTELEPKTWIAADANRKVYRLTELG